MTRVVTRICDRDSHQDDFCPLIFHHAYQIISFQLSDRCITSVSVHAYQPSSVISLSGICMISVSVHAYQFSSVLQFIRYMHDNSFSSCISVPVHDFSSVLSVISYMHDISFSSCISSVYSAIQLYAWFQIQFMHQFSYPVSVYDINVYYSDVITLSVAS